MPLFLDTGVLGLVTHPKAKGEAAACIQWLRDCMAAGSQVCVPEITDYEARRNMILEEMGGAVDRLNQLIVDVAEYIPLTTEAMRRAAELWAEMRRAHTPTADPKELDVDVILAAQAHKFATTGRRIVVTTNVGHLSRLHVEALRWQEIAVGQY